MLRGLLLGILIGFVLVFVGIYFYFATGQAPVATKSSEMPFEHRFAHMALDAYLSKRPHPNPPVSADETTFLAGAKVYTEHCAVCHGLPGEPKTIIADGMFPKPPQLFHGTGVTDDEPWETYWKVNSGIRMTGMPGFGDRLSETQMWQVSVLLKNADKISPAVKAQLLAALSPTGASTAAPATAPNPAPAPTTAPPAPH
ncbi:MAG TPA: cytochrome c [Candidatus Acidoferrum sp.]|nr:cytochrome c [Candidatus Acidoferrum sp.]